MSRVGCLSVRTSRVGWGRDRHDVAAWLAVGKTGDLLDGRASV
jgi:hypothetical protein